MGDFLDVLITVDDNYAEQASIMLYSLGKYVDNLTIHVIYDNLSKKAIQKLEKFIVDHDIGILKTHFFDTKELNLSVIKTDYITTTCYFRLYAPYIIKDVDRLLYLDPDIICQGSLEELFHLDMGDSIIAACPNMLKVKTAFLKKIILKNLHLPKDTIYVNSGVLLIDMQKYRDYMPVEKLNQFLQDNKDILEYHDQDTLNSLFLGKIHFLDQTYNYQINSVDWWKLDLNQTMIHYSEAKKPWKEDYNDTYRAKPYYQILRELGEVEQLKKLIQSHSSNSVSLLYDEFSIK